jgi:hypothetical protein
VPPAGIALKPGRMMNNKFRLYLKLGGGNMSVMKWGAYVIILYTLVEAQVLTNTVVIQY